MKTKYAVIIKHPYRDNDYRVDVVEVDSTVPTDLIERIIMARMLGPFEVVAITPKYDPARDITSSIERYYRSTENHIET